MDTENIKNYLDEKYLQYCKPQFIETDPIQIPHLFSQKNDIEIAGFLTASISWGNRTSIVKKARQLMNLLDDAPFDFVINSRSSDLKKLTKYVYRTFNDTDLLFFVASLQNIYKNHNGLQSVFEESYLKNNSIEEALIYFRQIFFEIPFPDRTQKHIANIKKKSAAKRLNMFLRWMVRPNIEQVDFGLWDKIKPSSLYLPLDVHAGNVARRLNILERKQNDWKAVQEATEVLRKFAPEDPVKYDYALFGIGVFEKKQQVGKL